MEDWFHAILEHLYKTYPLDHEFHVINDFLQQNLKIDNVEGNSLHRLSAILHILKEKGYIDGLPQAKDKSSQYELKRGQVIGLYVTGYPTRNSLLTHNIEIRLTIDGYVYMQERELKLEEHTSTMEVNQSSLRINKWFWLTMVLAGIGGIASIGDFINTLLDKPQPALLNQDSLLNTMMKQRIQIEHTLILDSLKIDSLEKILAKHK